MKIYYDPACPKEFVNLIEPYLRFFPSWFRELSIYYRETNTTAYLNNGTDHMYRRATLNFCPAFLTLTPEERERCILHEIAHFHMAGFHELVARMLDRIGTVNADEAKVWSNWYKETEEAFIEDIAVLFQDDKLFKPSIVYVYSDEKIG